MNEKSAVHTTHVCGFYNAAKWPIQLVISKLSLTLHLKPGEYILDRSGRKINDPFFESYPQLKKEISDEPVPLIAVPEVTPASVTRNNSPVWGTSKFKMSADGVRRPSLPPPVAEEAQQDASVGADPVRGMSMEEARRLGLARRVREVPEDYGATDNAGTPPRLPPTIKYAVDPSMLKKPRALPQELLKVDSKDAEGKPVPHVPIRTQLVSQLSKGPLTEAAPASASAFLNQVTPNAPANAPITTGPAMPRSVLRSRVPAPLPEPEMTEAEEMAAETGAATVDLPAPDLTELQEEQEQPPADLKLPAKRDRFVCAGCGLPFKFYSQLQKHAAARHKATYDAIMAAYPKEE